MIAAEADLGLVMAKVRWVHMRRGVPRISRPRADELRSHGIHPMWMVEAEGVTR
jgi:hypothetical protein